MSLMECAVLNCNRQPVWHDEDDTGDFLCQRHMPDPSVRSWSEMKAEGIEVCTMQEYRDEVMGFHDYPPEPPDPYDDYYDD